MTYIEVGMNTAFRSEEKQKEKVSSLQTGAARSWRRSRSSVLLTRRQTGYTLQAGVGEEYRKEAGTGVHLALKSL